MVAEETLPADAGLLNDEPDAAHDVALFNPGEKEHNTIVIGGVNVVVPLELDMDGDPFQDDEVCLRSLGGDWEHVVLSSDQDVSGCRDKRHLYYKFRDVPSGVYHVEVRIADKWTTVMTGLLVSQGVVRLGDRTLSEEPPAQATAVDDPHVLIAHEQPDPQDSTDPEDDCGCGA